MKLANIAKLATAGIGLSTLAINSSVFAATGKLNLGNSVGSSGSPEGAISENLVWTKWGLAEILQTTVQYFLSFVTFIAVGYGIYGGFLYLTSGWEEEKTKKAKAIFKQVAIGLIVIFLAYSVVNFVYTSLDTVSN
jgi:hypothetical protein